MTEEGGNGGRRREIAVFSGSFDPIHVGHAMVASYIAQWSGVDEVWILVSPLNPLKRDATPKASDSLRLEMAKAVFARDFPSIQVSDFEFSLPKPSFTVNTLRSLAARFPDCRFRLVVGSDNWLLFPHWREADRIISEFGVIIYPRPGYEIDAATLPSGVEILADAPQALISSSFIRDAFARGFRLDHFIPRGAMELLAVNNPYAGDVSIEDLSGADPGPGI